MSKKQGAEQDLKTVPPAVPEDEGELLAFLTDLRINKRMTMRQIVEETGVPLARVGRLLKGVEPAPEAPPASKEKDQPSRQPQYIQMIIQKEEAAKLFAIAIDEGYSGVEEFLEKSMLPWYRVKRNFEWKLNMKLDPVKFQAFIEQCIADQAELNEIKLRFASQTNKFVKQEHLLTMTQGAPGGG